MLEAMLAMLMMLPPPAASIFGSTARIMRNWARTLRANAASRSSSLASSDAAVVDPAGAVEEHVDGGQAGTNASIAWASSTSRRAVRMFATPAKPSSRRASTSVAQTSAPSAASARALARPMPCPAAVTSAVLSCEASWMSFSVDRWSLRGRRFRVSPDGLRRHATVP